MANYERVLLKLSGESLGNKNTPFDYKKIDELSLVIRENLRENIKMAIVIGGGNIFRGREGKEGTDPINNDYMGMSATVVNALFLGGTLKEKGLKKVVVMSSLGGYGKMENYDKEKALKYFDDGYLLILGGGIGKPGYTTDTTASQRAEDLKCEVVLKGSTIDGVYDKNPKDFPEAKKYDELTFDEAIEKKLKVMDTTAFEQCKRNNIPIIVFDMNDLDNIKRVISGEKIGTVVKNKL